MDKREYTVYLKRTEWIEKTVEAEDLDEAYEVAEDNYPSEEGWEIDSILEESDE